MITQLQAAKKGKITAEMKFTAKAEGVSAQSVKNELAAGRLVIPANIIHIKTNLKPVGIGRILTTKVNDFFTKS